MGTSLMKLPIFNESILRSHTILKDFGIDLIKIITNTDPYILNVVDSFVGITAIQVNIHIHLYFCILTLQKYLILKMCSK